MVSPKGIWEKILVFIFILIFLFLALSLPFFILNASPFKEKTKVHGYPNFEKYDDANSR
jgi:hypothetical protein